MGLQAYIETSLKDKMFDWVVQNKDWLFSGVAVSISVTLIGWLLSKRKSTDNNSKANGETVQYTQGEKSPAVNTKGDVNIRYGK